MKLRAFSKFENTTDALAAATSVGDSKLGKSEHRAAQQTSSVHFCAPACCGRLLDGRRDSSGALTRQSAPAGLKKFLKKNVDAETDTLAVLDAKLGGIVKEKMGIQCINK